VDVAVAIPYNTLQVDGAYRFQDDRTAHSVVTNSSVSLGVRGLGDIAIRTKARLLKDAGDGGLALMLDLRLPTGDDRNWLGAGKATERILVIGSKSYGNFSPRVNVGYSFGGPGDEINYVLGADQKVNDRLTVVADFIGRQERQLGSIVGVSQPYAPDPDHFSITTQQIVGSRLNSVLGSGGIKWNVSGNLIIDFDVLFAINDAGIKNRPSPVIGATYSFVH